FGEPDDKGIGQNQVLALQRFLTYSPWSTQNVQREIQSVFAQRLAPSTVDWLIGTVGVIDESGFVKKGKESVGVKRQYCGRVGSWDVPPTGARGRWGEQLPLRTPNGRGGANASGGDPLVRGRGPSRVVDQGRAGADPQDLGGK